MDFLHPENLCGQSLLALAARGNSVIAELLRLAKHVPSVFMGHSAGMEASHRKYVDVLFDFAYLKAPDRYEDRVTGSPDLSLADEEFQETYEELLKRFYSLFENIYKYVSDFLQFLVQLEDGFFLQYTLDDVLLNPHGKQLVCEVLYLYGVMLLMLERHVPGPVRERMVVALLRYQGEAAMIHLEEVTKLVKATGYIAPQFHESFGISGKAVAAALNPPDYPEAYFSRYRIPEEVVSMVVDRLRSDDVYNMIRIFPSPDHRTVALSQQASVLFVVLHFAPDVLNARRTAMREMVDKHFSDNWMVPVYMGWVVDLGQEWARFPAARDALMNTLNMTNVNELTERTSKWTDDCEKLLDQYLTEGVLTEDFVLDNLSKLQHCLRKCNATVRWWLLHRRCQHPRIREAVHSRSGVDETRLVALLLRTAQLEWRLKAMFQKLLDTKQERWEAARAAVADRMSELSDFFSGDRALTRVERDEGLQHWFKQKGEQVSSLAFEESTQSRTGRKIQKLIEALVEVEQFEEIDTSLQVKEFLSQSRELLTSMVRAVNVKDSVVATLDSISDLSYAWETLPLYVPQFHARIREDPRSTLLFRALLLKLASILDVPLTRITQADSKDAVSVAEYYSNELLALLRRTLAVVPQSVFATLRELVVLQTTGMTPLPQKVEVATLKQHAQLEARYRLARATHLISRFTEGVLAMESTLLGVIEVEPRQILEDGVRQELVKQIAVALDTGLVFTPARKRDGVTAALVTHQLQVLERSLQGVRQAMEYAQDYLGMYGLRIWQEELSRVLGYSVEQHCNRFVKRKILDSRSHYQTADRPIPKFKPRDARGHNAIGRLTRALLAITDPRSTVYVPECSGWYEVSGAEVAGIRFFDQLTKAVGVQGLVGLDRVLCFRATRDIKRCLRAVSTLQRPVADAVRVFEERCLPLHALPADGVKAHAVAIKKTAPILSTLVEMCLRVGQSQLLRRQIRHSLQFACRLRSPLLSSAVEGLNEAVLRDVYRHYAHPDKYPYPPPKCQLLPELKKYLESCGQYDPLTTIFTTCEPLPVLPALLALMTLQYMRKMEYDAEFGTLVSSSPRDGLDGAPIVVGAVTLLRQFHPKYTAQYLAFVGQFMRAVVNTTFDARATRGGSAPSLPADMTCLTHFLRHLCHHASINPATALPSVVPSFVLASIAGSA